MAAAERDGFTWRSAPLPHDVRVRHRQREELAEQMLWAARTPAGRDQAFNTANGDVCRWRWLWFMVAAWLHLEWVGDYAQQYCDARHPVSVRDEQT